MKGNIKAIICGIGVCLASLANSTPYIDGLHFIKSPDLVIDRQDITLNLEQITLVYTLINTSNQDITETLMFSSPMQNPTALMVDDQPAQYRILHRAVSNKGIDISNTLKNLGLSFDPITAMHSLDNSINRDSLRKSLAALGLIDKKDETPLWTNITYYYWQQKFPAKSSIKIRHSYKPVIAIKNMKVKGLNEFLKVPLALVKKLFFQDENVANMLKTQLEKHNPEIAAFCPSAEDFVQIIGSNKIENISRIMLGKELNFNTQQDLMWVTPVNRFSLTIEAADDMQPILCRNESLKRKQGNILVFETDNFVPIESIRVLFLQRLKGTN